jgi:hypothetical protein
MSLEAENSGILFDEGFSLSDVPLNVASVEASMNDLGSLWSLRDLVSRGDSGGGSSSDTSGAAVRKLPLNIDREVLNIWLGEGSEADRLRRLSDLGVNRPDLAQDIQAAKEHTPRDGS